MAKSKNIFFCQECGYESAKWLGQCPACKAWNAFVEEPTDWKGEYGFRRIRHQAKASEPVLLSSVHSSDEKRRPTGISEFDRVLGGGIVPGSLVLVGGDPGIGKSTLLLQMSQVSVRTELPDEFMCQGKNLCSRSDCELTDWGHLRMIWRCCVRRTWM